MDTSDIRTLYAFNDWANGRLLPAVAALAPADVTRDLGGSFRTIRDVVAHLVSAEWVWLERWNGVSPTAIPEWAVSGGVPDLTSQLTRVRARRDSFLQSLDTTALSAELRFTYISGAPATHTLGDALVHVVNHSTYHRGQLASMLRQVGAAPPPTDFIVFRAGR